MKKLKQMESTEVWKAQDLNVILFQSQIREQKEKFEVDTKQ